MSAVISSDTNPEPPIPSPVPSPVPPLERPPERPRQLGIDVLRGLAVFGMMFAGVIPWDGLPRWMYHGQEPPPTHNFNPNLAALTWVDLVFPFFLFSMGASIPLAISGRLKRGETFWQAILGCSSRFVLLVAFAIVNQHLRPYTLSSDPNSRVWWIGILGFLLMVPIYARLPVQWPGWLKVATRIAGWAGVAVLLSRLTYASSDMPRFSLNRGDPIILVLATCSLFGTLAWILTRQHPSIRVWLMAAVFAWRVSALQTGSWAQQAWDYDGPTGWFFAPSYLGYLLVLIPGTFVGDLLLQPQGESEPPSWGQDLLLACLCFLAIPACLYVFLERIDSVVLLPLAGVIAWLGSRASSKVVRSLTTWGCALLAIGLLLEPFQGGIKKDHPTLSYVLATPGLAMLMLCALTILESRVPKSRILKFVATTGQNPMLAYEALTNLVEPVWSLTIAGWVTEHTPGTAVGVARAVLQTVILGVVVNAFTKLKVVFRT